MSDAYIKVTDASLEVIGCETLFDNYRAQIATALVEQEEGSRADGDVELTIKVKIGRREEGLRYHATASLKTPGYVGQAAIGNLLHAGKGEAPRLRIQRTDAKQMLIPGTTPFADEDEQSAH